MEQRGAGQRQRWVRVDMAEACRAQGSGEANGTARFTRADTTCLGAQLCHAIKDPPEFGRSADWWTSTLGDIYGTNTPRLQQLKQKFDPGNFFQNNRNITPFNKVSLEEDSTAHAQHTLVHVHVHVAALSWDVQGPEGYIQD